MSIENLKSWSGDVLALAGQASRVLADQARQGGDVSARLVRDYVRRGIVNPPVRRGHAAIFGFEQLVQLIAARILVGEGWPLAKIAEWISGAKGAELVALVVGSAPAAEFSAQRRPRADTWSGSQSEAGQDWPGDAIEGAGALIARHKAELRNRRRRLDWKMENTFGSLIVEFEIADECRLLVSQRLLDALDLERALDLAQVLASTLVVGFADRRRKK